MKKPQTLIEAFRLAEVVTTRKQAKKLLKRTKKLIKKQHDLLKEQSQTELPEGEADDSGTGN